MALSRPITKPVTSAETFRPVSSTPTPKSSNSRSGAVDVTFQTVSLGTSPESKQKRFRQIKGRAITDGVASGATVLKPSSLSARGSPKDSASPAGAGSLATSPTGGGKQWRSTMSPYNYTDFLQFQIPTSVTKTTKKASGTVKENRSASPVSSDTGSDTTGRASLSESFGAATEDLKKRVKGKRSVARDLEFSDHEDENKDVGKREGAVARTDSIATVRKRLLSASSTPGQPSLIVAGDAATALTSGNSSGQATPLPHQMTLPPPQQPKPHVLDELASTHSTLNIMSNPYSKAQHHLLNTPLTARPPPAPIQCAPSPPTPSHGKGTAPPPPQQSPLAKRRQRENEFGVGSKPQHPTVVKKLAAPTIMCNPHLRKPLYMNIVLQQCIIGSGLAVTSAALQAVAKSLGEAAQPRRAQPSLSALRALLVFSSATELILDNRVTLRYDVDRWAERQADAEVAVMGEVMASRRLNPNLVTAADAQFSKQYRLKRQEERETRLVSFWKAKEAEEKRLRDQRNTSAFGFGQNYGYGVRFVGVDGDSRPRSSGQSQPPLLPAQPPMEQVPSTVLRGLLFAAPASTVREWVVAFRNTAPTAPPTSLEQYRINHKPKEAQALMGFDKNGEVIVVYSEGTVPKDGQSYSPPKTKATPTLDEFEGPTDSPDAQQPPQEDLLSKSAAIFVLTGKRGASGSAADGASGQSPHQRGQSVVWPSAPNNVANLEASIGRNSILGKGVSSLRRYMSTTPSSRGSGGGPTQEKSGDSKKVSRTNSRKSVVKSGSNKQLNKGGRPSSFYRRSFKAFEDSDEAEDDADTIGDTSDPNTYNLFSGRKGLSIPPYLKPLYSELKTSATFLLACLGEELAAASEGANATIRNDKMETDGGSATSGTLSPKSGSASPAATASPPMTASPEPEPTNEGQLQHKGSTAPESLIVSLGRQQITVDQLAYILGRLEGHTGLQKLAIRQSGLDTMSLVTLGEWALRVPPLLGARGSLHTVDLSGNRIKSTDLPCLEAALFACPYLRSLSLRNNPLRQKDDTFASLESLLFALGDRLEHLDVGLCGLNDSAVGKICSYLRDAEASGVNQAGGALRRALQRTGGVAADLSHYYEVDHDDAESMNLKGPTNLVPMVRLNMDGATISTSMATLLLYTLHTSKHLLDLGIAFVSSCNTKSYLRHVTWVLDRNLRAEAERLEASAEHNDTKQTRMLHSIAEFGSTSTSSEGISSTSYENPHAPHPPLTSLISLNDRRKALLDAWERRDKDTQVARQRMRSERASVVAESLRNLRLYGGKGRGASDASHRNSQAGAPSSRASTTSVTNSVVDLEGTMAGAPESSSRLPEVEAIAPCATPAAVSAIKENPLDAITPLPDFTINSENKRAGRKRVVKLEALDESPRRRMSVAHPQDQALHELLNSTRKGSPSTNALNGEQPLNLDSGNEGTDSEEDGFNGEEEKALERMLRDAGTHGGLLRGKIDSALPIGYAAYSSNTSVPSSFPNPYFYIPSDEEREGFMVGGMWNGGGRKSLTKALSALRKFQTIVPMRKRSSVVAPNVGGTVVRGEIVTGITRSTTEGQQHVPQLDTQQLAETEEPSPRPFNSKKDSPSSRKRSTTFGDAADLASSLSTMPFGFYGKGSSAELLVNSPPTPPQRNSASADREGSREGNNSRRPSPPMKPPLTPHRPSIASSTSATTPTGQPRRTPSYSSALLRHASTVADATTIRASMTFQRMRQSITESSSMEMGGWAPNPME